MVPARRRRGRRDRVGAVLAGKSVTTSMPTARPARQGRQTRSTPSSPNTSCTRATACGVRTTATLPAGAFGPSVGANGSHADGRLSPEQARRPGSDERRIRARYLGRRCRRLPEDPEIASRALAVSVEEARAFVVEAPVKHADETGWREARRRAWLWTVVTATVFMIHTRRNAVAALARSSQAPVLLGAPDSRLRQDRRATRRLRAHRQRVARRSRADVRMVASGTRRHAQALHLHRLHALGSAPRRIAARRGRRRASFQDLENVREAAEARRRSLDLPLRRRRRADEQHRGARGPARRSLSQDQLRHALRSSRFIERILSVHATLRPQRRNVRSDATSSTSSSTHSRTSPLGRETTRATSVSARTCSTSDGLRSSRISKRLSGARSPRNARRSCGFQPVLALATIRRWRNARF